MLCKNACLAQKDSLSRKESWQFSYITRAQGCCFRIKHPLIFCCTQALLSLLSWAWSTLKASVGDLVDTLPSEASLMDLQRLVFICRSRVLFATNNLFNLSYSLSLIHSLATHFHRVSRHRDPIVCHASVGPLDLGTLDL